MQVKSILNRVQKFKSFVYGNISWVEDVSEPTLEVELQLRRNSRPVCSVCGHRRPGYDKLPRRRFGFIPIWGIKVFFLYATHRVDCPECGVRVERLPWVNLTRYHGVFAPNSQHRVLVTPERRGRANKAQEPGREGATPVASHAAMSWAQRLKRVFAIDIETCSVCGGSMKVIAAIENPLVIKKILTHLRGKDCIQRPPVCRRAGRHRRATCSADARTSMTRNSYGCNPDGCGRLPLGQLAGMWL